MTPAETREILASVDTALRIYRKNEGKLNAQEVRLKSLLAVVRAELIEEVSGENVETVWGEIEPG